MLKRCRAQSIVEYSILLIILMVAFLSMQVYMKRGIQGRWKSTLDDFGEQYDPYIINSQVTYSLLANSQTIIQAVPSQDPTGNPITGFVTNRTDSSRSFELKSGNSTIGRF